MKHLFNTTSFFYDTPVYYKIIKVGDNEYFAEAADKTMKGFILKKCSGAWIARGWCTEMQVVQIGDKIDKFF